MPSTKKKPLKLMGRSEIAEARKKKAEQDAKKERASSPKKERSSKESKPRQFANGKPSPNRVERRGSTDLRFSHAEAQQKPAPKPTENKTRKPRADKPKTNKKPSTRGKKAGGSEMTIQEGRDYLFGDKDAANRASMKLHGMKVIQCVGHSESGR